MSDRPEPRRSSEAVLAQLRAWHESRFGARRQAEPHVSLIKAHGPNGSLVMIDTATGEIVPT